MRDGQRLPEWSPVAAITLSPSDTTQYIRARPLSNAPAMILASQLRITVQCVSWSQSTSRFSTPTPPQTAKGAGVKFMLCVYGTENYVDTSVDMIEKQHAELARMCKEQKNRVDQLRLKLTKTIHMLDRSPNNLDSKEGGVLPQNLSDMTKSGADADRMSLGDYNLGSLKDEMEMLPTRMVQLRKLAKMFPKQKKGPFVKSHPTADLLIQLGDELSELTYSVDLQHLSFQSESLRQLLAELYLSSNMGHQRTSDSFSDGIKKFWESSIGPTVFGE